MFNLSSQPGKEKARLSFKVRHGWRIRPDALFRDVCAWAIVCRQARRRHAKKRRVCATPNIRLLCLTLLEIEHHFDGSMPILLAANNQGVFVLVQAEAMGYQACGVESLLREEAQVNFHGMQ